MKANATEVAWRRMGGDTKVVDKREEEDTEEVEAAAKGRRKKAERRRPRRWPHEGERDVGQEKKKNRGGGWYAWRGARAGG